MRERGESVSEHVCACVCACAAVAWIGGGRVAKNFANSLGMKERERERAGEGESLSVCRALLHSNTSDVRAAAAAKKLKFATESVELDCLDLASPSTPTHATQTVQSAAKKIRK